VKLIPGPAPQDFRASIARTYDGVAALRDERGEEEWRWPIADRFLTIMRREGRRRLLEIGAGVGYTSRWFADRGLEVVATDLSSEQVERCRAKGLDARVADMYDLGFPPGSFDAAWAMNCIHHVPNSGVAAVFSGIADVVTEGAPVYVGVWGGVDDEGMAEEDFYLPPRFFSFRSDRALTALIESSFVIEAFEAFRPDGEDDGLHMQSFFLRTRS